jgi:signal transduction histidine kinase
VTRELPENERIALLVHELRSPVAALAAIAEAAREDGTDSDSLRQLAGLAFRSCRSIARIVDDVALGALELERIDLARLLDDAVTAATLEGASVRLTNTGSLDMDADAVRLRQAVDNLIRNALEHSGSSAAVRVHGERDGDVVVVTVTDSGRGIAAEDRDRIFERGTRLGASAGSGLGLDVVRQIVDAHGGTVRVDSALGKGATFTIVLPMRHH